MTLKITKPTLRLILTTEFGDVTDVTQDLLDSSMEHLFWAVRHALAGCGYSEESIQQWFPEEE
jgi:hypothetical protein